MPPRTYTIAVSALIAGPPAACYRALGDYRTAHPAIVPPRYFGPIVVEAGGVGAGTRIRCSLRMMGRSIPFTADVTEPEPGRVLVETIPETGAVTRFIVIPEGAEHARVTIETRLQRASGIRGVLEPMFTRRLFPRIYAEELERLAAHVGGTVVGTPRVTLSS
jgi:hypothetical protein